MMAFLTAGFVVALFIIWTLLHVHMVSLVGRRLRQPRVLDPNLQDPKNQMLDMTNVPNLRIDNEPLFSTSILSIDTKALIHGRTSTAASPQSAQEMV